VRWFKRHLNWTIVLSWMVAALFWVIFGGSLGWHSDSATVIEVGPIVSSEAFGGWVVLIGLVGTPAIVLLATGWALRRKNRSLLHLLWYLLFWIGAIVLLCLKNQSEVIDIEGGKLATRPRSESD